MATDTLPKGRTIALLEKDESAFATLPSGNWNQTIAYGPISLGETQKFVDDPVLGAGLVNTVDTSQPAPDLPSAGGSLVLPLDYSHMGRWLKRAFGADTPTGSNPDYVHVFASGVEALPTFAVEVKKAASIFYDTLGCAVTSLVFNANRKAGYDRFTANIIAAKESKNTTSQGGTPTAMLARAPAAASLPVFKLNGTIAGQVLAIDATYDNHLIGQDFMSGDPHIAGIERDMEATFTGTLKVRFKDATYHDLGISGATFSGELLWQTTSTRSLSLLAPLMRIERTPIVIPGPGGIEVDFPFRAEADATNAMLTATLKSTVATF